LCRFRHFENLKTRYSKRSRAFFNKLLDDATLPEAQSAFRRKLRNCVERYSATLDDRELDEIDREVCRLADAFVLYREHLKTRKKK
jgi:hypothetical protein